MSEQAPEQGTQEDRISRIESAVNRLAEQVSRIIPTSHAEAEERTERRLDRPSSVEEQMQAARRQAKAELKAEQDAAATKAALDDHGKQLAAMRERPPADAPAENKLHKFMGWTG